MANQQKTVKHRLLEQLNANSNSKKSKNDIDLHKECRKGKKLMEDVISSETSKITKSSKGKTLLNY